MGKNTDVLRSKDIGEHYAQECAFSIIYSEQFESMDLIANTPDEANIWVTGLTCLINKNKGGKLTLSRCRCRLPPLPASSAPHVAPRIFQVIYNELRRLVREVASSRINLSRTQLLKLITTHH